MESLNIKLQENKVLESWEIFRITGDVFDAMELMADLRELDLLNEDYFERE